MTISLTKVPYKQLNARQKESHNFQKVSAALADFGYSTIRLQDDWQGADFIAQHCDGTGFLKIQLKSRAVLAKKYMSKELCIVFPHNNKWYLYEHDALLELAKSKDIVSGTSSWETDGKYTWSTFPAHLVNSGPIHEL